MGYLQKVSTLKSTHLTPSQLADIGDKNRATIAAHVPKPGGDTTKKALQSSDCNVPRHERTSDAVVAKSVGVGEATVRRMAAVRKDDEKNNTGAVERIRTGSQP